MTTVLFSISFSKFKKDAVFCFEDVKNGLSLAAQEKLNRYTKSKNRKDGPQKWDSTFDQSNNSTTRLYTGTVDRSTAGLWYIKDLCYSQPFRNTGLYFKVLRQGTL